MSFDPVEICAVLTEEGVEFVVLGGFAAIIHGSSLPTEDIDVIPSRRGSTQHSSATCRTCSTS